MKPKKAILFVTLALLFGYGVYRVWDERLWPFSTGTKDEAFLGTTFGMSQQEVRRSLKHHGAQLLNYEEYRRTEADPAIEKFGTPLFSDEAREYDSLYM